MTSADLAVSLLLTLAAALAWHRGARPLALTLAWGLASHLALCALATLPQGPVPFSGGRAWWFRGEIALRMVWPGAVWVGVAAEMRRTER